MISEAAVKFTKPDALNISTICAGSALLMFSTKTAAVAAFVVTIT
jgi:hypothetical protein